MIAGDIGDESHCRKIVEQAAQEFGKIDIPGKNAAFQMSHEGIEDLPSDEIEKTFRTNIFAMFYLCKAVIPHLDEGGAIINTASIQADQPSKQMPAYAATKGAIVNFTKGLNEDLVEKGIRINAVAPGPGLDTFDCLDDAAGKSRGIRQRFAEEATGAARRTCARVCFSRLGRSKSYQRRNFRRNRRQTFAVI